VTKKIDVRSAFFWMIIYLAIVVVIISSGYFAISVAVNEIGDFAANSLLIQEAKSFGLLVGNYSRVGFNHPGPAILYVLAAGEYLFYDRLALVDHAFSGQLIAVAFYNAFWLTLIAVLLRKMGLARHIVLMAVSAFCLVSAIEDHSFFNGVWMPHLYFFPFAVMLFSLARLLQEKSDSLWMLAISSGFLINGHASFIAVLGLMLIIVLAYSYFAGSKRGGVLRPDFIKSNSVSLLIAIGLLALFFIPLLILTVREFPGPLGDYLAFGGGHKPNKLAEAFSFVSIYWGGMSVFLVSIVAFALLWFGGRFDRYQPVTRSLLVVVLAATLAMLFYAKYGVDYLGETYIGFFYFAVPSALAVAVSIFVAQRLGTGSLVKGLGVAVSIAVLATSYFIGSKPPFYVDQFHGAQISELAKALSSEKGSNGRLVLDLDSSKDWPHVWAVAAGVAALSKRQGESVFCVNESWHILFTKELRCTSEELAHSKRFVMRRAQDGDDQGAPIQLGGVSLTQVSPPRSAD